MDRSFAHGLTSALVVDVGASKTSVTPVENGFQVMMGHKRSGVAGDFLDSVAAALVPGLAPRRAGRAAASPEWLDPLAAHTAAQREALERQRHDAARSLREALGSCGAPALTPEGSFDMEAAVTTPGAATTEDGGTVPGEARLAMGQPLLMAPGPSGTGPGAEGATDLSRLLPARPAGSSALAELVVSSLAGLDDATRSACGEAVLLTGGAACTAHCADRLGLELERLGGSAALGVSLYLLPVPLEETVLSPWMGGSIVASAGTLPDLFVSADEWAKLGREELHRRCP